MVMKKLFTSNKIYVSESKIVNADRGVFAKCDIKKDEVIERCPIIEVSKDDTSNLKESILVTYFFYYGKDREKLLIALGFGSIYNHSYKPNAKYKIQNKEKRIDFLALNDIKKDEEITFNYYNSIKSKTKKSPLWFEI